MAFLGAPLQVLCLFVVPVLAIDVHQLEECSAATGRGTVVDEVIGAVCAYDTKSDVAATFRNETRARHNGSAKTDS